MLSRRIIRSCVVLLLVAAALAPLGCKAKSAESESQSGNASVVTSGAATTATGVATGTTVTPSPDGAADSSAEPSSKITASEAAALDAELAAIQQELDKLSIPDDGDFSGIESGLQ